MLCALTVRKLKPGTFDQFHAAFTGGFDPGGPPPGWVRFEMLRHAESPDEVICFGFFDGSVEKLRASESDMDYESQMAAIAPFVESVGTNGIYEVVDERVA